MKNIRSAEGKSQGKSSGRASIVTLPDGTKGYFSKRDNTIVLSDSLFGKEADTVLHEIQHVIQKTEGFTGGASPEYWNRRMEEGYSHRKNEGRVKQADREYRRIFDNAPEAFRKKVREINRYRLDGQYEMAEDVIDELYGGEYADLWEKLETADFERRRDLGEEMMPSELYRNTAGEIEARDTANRRKLTAEERKNTPPDMGDADTVFADGATAYSINENFEKDVDAWLENTPEDMRSTSPGYFRVGTTSEALQSIGARTDNIYMRKSKIGTILEEHPEIDAGIIKSVPNVLENPVLVMKSITRTDSIVVFGEEKAMNGSNLMVALELTPKPGGSTEMEFSLVTSAYGRSDENVQNLISNSELLYLDSNKREPIRG